jgi:hypothetical protein
MAVFARRKLAPPVITAEVELFSTQPAKAAS